jgi:hypothetical protein
MFVTLVTVVTCITLSLLSQVSLLSLRQGSDRAVTSLFSHIPLGINGLEDLSDKVTGVTSLCRKLKVKEN